MFESTGWREDRISDKVRLPVKKVIDILGDLGIWFRHQS